MSSSTSERNDKRARYSKETDLILRQKVLELRKFSAQRLAHENDIPINIVEKWCEEQMLLGIIFYRHDSFYEIAERRC